MDAKSREWQTRFTKIWDEGNYRRGSCGQRLIPEFLKLAPKPCTVNDYGSGTGRAAAELMKMGYFVNMVDIAPNALEDEAIKFAAEGKGTFTLASLWDLPEDFPDAEWGYCTDVLMTIPEDRIEPVLMEIYLSCHNCFFEMFKWQDPRCGMDLTATQWSAINWKIHLEGYWADVRQISVPEDTRYVFACMRE